MNGQRLRNISTARHSETETGGRLLFKAASALLSSVSLLPLPLLCCSFLSVREHSASLLSISYHVFTRRIGLKSFAAKPRSQSPTLQFL
jgi:hypothetical protein